MRLFFVFYNTSYLWRDIKEIYNIAISESFLDCADLQLKIDFERQTGIKPKQGKVGITFSFDRKDFKYIKNSISKLDIWVAIIDYTNTAKICWKSKSGRVYEPSDEDIDCNDIQFWFEGLDPALYHKQLYPNDPLPFKLKETYFPIEINRLTIDLSLSIFFQESTQQSRQLLLDKVGKLINDWNLKTEKEDTLKIAKGLEEFDSKGVIHNHNIVKNEEDYLEILIDLGSAEVIVIKQLINLFTKEPGIAKLVID